MNELFLNDEFTALWHGRDPLAEAKKLEGEIFRSVKSRRTFRFELKDRGYFAKVHRGVGWREIVKNLLQFKRPVLGAGNEYRAIRHCERIGVPTMTAAAYASRGVNPGAVESFLITEELAGCVSLEDYCRDWREQPPSWAEKTALLAETARMVGAMHRSGLNHRDCYLCHFLLRLATAGSVLPELHVIDLHRAQIRAEAPFRYRVKDVAGLYFSSMDIGLTRRDRFRFIADYSLRPLRYELKVNRCFWRAVSRAAHRLYRKEHGRNPSACSSRD